MERASYSKRDMRCNAVKESMRSFNGPPAHKSVNRHPNSHLRMGRLEPKHRFENQLWHHGEECLIECSQRPAQIGRNRIGCLSLASKRPLSAATTPASASRSLQSRARSPDLSITFFFLCYSRCGSIDQKFVWLSIGMLPRSPISTHAELAPTGIEVYKFS